MKIEINPEAVKRFNERARDLLFCLTPKSKKNKAIGRDFNSGIIMRELREEEIISFGPSGEIDYSGKMVSMFFKHNNVSIGLEGENFKKLIKLCEDIQKAGNLFECASIDFILGIFFQWMKLKYSSHYENEMLTYFIEKCEQEIKSYEIWIPIAHTIVEEEFRIGNVTLKNFSKEVFGNWESELLKNVKDDEAIRSVKERLLKERETTQGYAVAVFNVTAENIRAEELAFEKVEMALSLVRIFSPAAFFINSNSFTTIRGTENLQRKDCYVFSNNRIITHMEALIPTRILWTIRKEELQGLQVHLPNFSQLLNDKNLNSFQLKVLNALLLFSKSILTKSIPDKLVYIFASLESVLLKDENEPIQQNLADRLAFAITNNGEERIKIVKNIKEAYKYRSKFIHHGISINEIAILDEFLKNAWVYLLTLTTRINDFKTKEEMINAIEKRKYGVE
ncbi:MAG: HEPN domain-containing protein [Ignavibacteriaceae bacterium]|nr:HEPN domain-containing protein [Ignavibacteriaceae bacterium]